MCCQLDNPVLPHLHCTCALPHRSWYYAVKKVFVNFFAKLFEVFQSFRKFGVLASFSRLSDPFGLIGMHSEAIGSVWTFSKIFWDFFDFWIVFQRFRTQFSENTFSTAQDKCSCFAILAPVQPGEVFDWTMHQTNVRSVDRAFDHLFAFQKSKYIFCFFSLTHRRVNG